MSGVLDRRVSAYLDLEAVRELLVAGESSPARLVEQVIALARDMGRLSSAVAYGDVDHETSRELRRMGCLARLTVEDGEGSVPESIAITYDVATAIARNEEAETVVLVSDDAQLAELIQRIRRSGRYVVVVVPEALASQEPAQAADRSVSVESLLLGGAPQKSASPAPAPQPQTPPQSSRPPLRRESSYVHGGPLDLETYDWSRFVLLLRDLEERMPFVGMRWLKNKVIGQHNVGVSSVGDKQLLLNKAVDDGLVETYRVGNREEGGEPVTACRLLRDNPLVSEVLEANPSSENPDNLRDDGSEAGESAEGSDTASHERMEA